MSNLEKLQFSLLLLSCMSAVLSHYYHTHNASDTRCVYICVCVGGGISLHKAILCDTSWCPITELISKAVYLIVSDPSG